MTKCHPSPLPSSCKICICHAPSPPPSTRPLGWQRQQPLCAVSAAARGRPGKPVVCPPHKDTDAAVTPLSALGTDT